MPFSDLVLENDDVKLSALKILHWQDLWPVAQQVDLFKYGSSDVSTTEKLKSYIDQAIDLAYAKKAIPFIIYNKKSKAFVGSTRFGNIDFKHKVLHIGWTWISPETRGTGFNHQMKFLMLRYAFEELQFEKVEFRIDERNMASRKAVEKLGATLEGILRKNVITKNDFRRSSCCYGILREEWSDLKKEVFK